MDILSSIEVYNKSENDKEIAEILAFFEENYKQFLSSLDMIESERKCIYAISMLSRKKKIANFIVENESLFNKIPLYAKSDDGKVRKNAYSAMYHLGVCDKDFFDGLEIENANYIILHIVKLLLKRDKKNAEKLNELSDKWDSSDKHIIEAITAIEKAINDLSCGDNKDLYIKTLLNDDKILLTCPKVGQEILYNDTLKALGNARKSKCGVIVEGLKDVSKLNEIRSFNEALIIVDKLFNVRITFSEFVKILAESLVNSDILYRYGIKDRAIDYRVEYNAKCSFDERIRKTETIVKTISGNSGFRNSTNNYFVLIKIDETDGVFCAYLTCKFNDERFGYRKNKISASINPVTANIISALAEKYIVKNESVLDCFSGTGTMLIEFAKRYETKVTVSSDIDRSAIEMAKENFELADIKTAKEFYVSDAAKFFYKDKFDVVISNLPFGIRVLRHDAVKRLYKGFIGNLRTLLSDDGIAILVTTDGKDLRKELLNNSFNIKAELRIESGGLIPFVFIVSK